MSNDYYDPTAYDSSHSRHLPSADESQFSAGIRSLRRNKLPNLGNPQCREFLSRIREPNILEQLKKNTTEVQMLLQEPGHEIQYWETLRNPKAVLRVLTKLMLVFSVISAGSMLFLMIVALFKRPDYFTNTDFLISVLITPCIPSILYLIGKSLLKHSHIENKNNILFNRRKGTISIPRKKKPPLELPFDEFDGFLGSTVNPSGSTDYHLILAHRYSASFIQHPGGRETPWEINIEWELIQQFMDISHPLPDIPSAEPFRDKDPVTAKYDKRHHRPPRYWRDMDIAKARQMHEASFKAASTYPWGLTREQAMASGWQPSGFGEGDWRKRNI